MAKKASYKTSSAQAGAASGQMSNLVRLWLKQKPFMHWLVREGLMNYTALARRLNDEGFGSGKRPVAALRTALLRSRKLDLGEFQPFGSNNVLKDSKFEIRSDVVVTGSQKALGIPVIAVASSKNQIISIVDCDEEKNIPRHASIIDKNLVLVTIYSDDRMETEPGVLATLLLHFALQGVNVVELTSCGTDTLILIKPSDLPTALSVLQALMSGEKRSTGAKALFSYSKPIRQKE